MIDFLCGHKAENLFIIVKRSRVELKWEQSVFSETLVWLRLKVNLGRRPHRDHRAGNFYPHMWRHASFKLLLIRRNNEPSRPITDRLGTQGVGGNDTVAVQMFQKKSVAALVSGDVWSYVDVGLVLMPWQKGNSRRESRSFCLSGHSSGRVQTPSLTLFLFLRGQDAETEKLFPHFHKLQKSAFPECKSAFVFRLSSHSSWTHNTFFTLSSSHCTSATFSLFLHQRNSIMHDHCSRGERLWPLASPPGYERHKGPSCILSGASGQKKTIWRLTGHHFSS